MLLVSYNVTGQKILDTPAIMKTIFGGRGYADTPNSDLNNTILALDRQLDEVLGGYSDSRRGKYIILRKIGKAKAIGR